MIGVRTLALALLIPAATATAAPVPGEAQMMRETWGKTSQPDMTIVQPVFGRVISFKLPRGFVIAWRQQVPGGYLAEYIPDGETLENWTRMITLTASIGAGAARVEDAELADVLYNKPGCPGWRYRDFGAAANPGSARRRTLLIGCDATAPAAYDKAVVDAAERAAIGFFRDEETVWTLQYAERTLPGTPGKVDTPGKPRSLFDPDTAPARLDRLAITTCGDPKLRDDCRLAAASK